MYKSFFLLEEPEGLVTSKRIYLGEETGKDEAWLRDTLFNHPEIIPVNEIDSTFGPLVPLCTELQTGNGGRIDAAFINEHGRLTIVECKLWKNPQARREVVAQTLDYVAALSSWTYADLQRQVSAALGQKGNVPYELVKSKTAAAIDEREFVDAVSRSLREGRFLVLIAGDGIRDGMQSLTQLINRNATKAFSFGIVEVALYDLGQRRLAIQPRVLLETELITRQIMVLNSANGSSASIDVEEMSDDTDNESKPKGARGHHKDWWMPVLNMTFDDPEQERPYWVGTNNVVLKTPFPGILIKAYAVVDGTNMGVFISGTRSENPLAIKDLILREKASLLKELPKGTEILEEDPEWPIICKTGEISGDDARHKWIIQTLNSFVNALRPRLKKWYSDSSKSA